MKLVIFGCGNIASRIAKGALSCDNIKLVGFASKNIDKAKEYAEKFGCARYGCYDDFLNDPTIDAVYVATHNPSHYSVIETCLMHHKNVICEKPMLSSLKENDELFTLALKQNCLLMEAMKAVFLPINIQTKEKLQRGDYGNILYAKASFIRESCFDESHWINDLHSGGALKDLGSYCAAILNFVMDREPDEISVATNAGKVADTYGAVSLKYGNISAAIEVSNMLEGPSSLLIITDRGYVQIPDFWKAQKGFGYIDHQKIDFEAELINDFHYELHHFAKCVDTGIKQSEVMSRQFSDSILKITCSNE